VTEGSRRGGARPGAGRPSKYSVELVGRFCVELARGSSIAYACRAAGIGHSTYKRWLHEHPEFKDAVANASAESERALVRQLQDHAENDWRAAKFLLERRFPQWRADTSMTQERRDELDDLRILKAKLELQFAALKIEHASTGREQDTEFTKILNEIHALEVKEDPKKVH